MDPSDITPHALRVAEHDELEHVCFIYQIYFEQAIPRITNLEAELDGYKAENEHLWLALGEMRRIIEGEVKGSPLFWDRLCQIRRTGLMRREVDRRPAD